MQLAKSIREEAVAHKLKIKRVFFGKNVARKLKQRRLGRKLSDLLSSKSLKKRMKKLRRRIKKATRRTLKRANLIKGNKKSNLSDDDKEMARKLTISMSGGGGSSKGKGKEDEMEFNFLPGFAGMPFPPFMMNGPHYHPPLNVTVNALPHPNVRAMNHPSALKEENLTENQEMMEPIIEKLGELDSVLTSATSDTNVDLNGKYDQVLMNF